MDNLKVSHDRRFLISGSYDSVQFWNIDNIPTVWTEKQHEAHADGSNEEEEEEEEEDSEGEDERERRSKRKKRKRKWQKFVEEEERRDKKHDNFFSDL